MKTGLEGVGLSSYTRYRHLIRKIIIALNIKKYLVTNKTHSKDILTIIMAQEHSKKTQTILNVCLRKTFEIDSAVPLTFILTQAKYSVHRDEQHNQ